jgi:hypothetical protein
MLEIKNPETWGVEFDKKGRKTNTSNNRTIAG